MLLSDRDKRHWQLEPLVRLWPHCRYLSWNGVTSRWRTYTLPISSSWQRLASSPLLNGSLQLGVVSLIQFSVPLVRIWQDPFLKSFCLIGGKGLFCAGYAAVLTPSSGIVQAYERNTAQYNNALKFFMICKWFELGVDISIANRWPQCGPLTFLIASLPTNPVYISIFFLVDLGFLMVAASYFAEADGHRTSAEGLKKASGVFFVSSLVWLDGILHFSCSWKTRL